MNSQKNTQPKSVPSNTKEKVNPKQQHQGDVAADRKQTANRDLDDTTGISSQNRGSNARQ